MKTYFPNLNSLRFFAALCVFVHHVEQLKSLFGLPNVWGNPQVGLLGKLGVVFFFVLSGFLITQLLLAEKNLTGRINLKIFYLKRVLRIWPLYFIIVLSSIFILPDFLPLRLPSVDYDRIFDFIHLKLILLFLFLPNLMNVYFGFIPYSGQVWSIGVEEQFYLFWPILIGRAKRILFALLAIILGSILIEYLLQVLGNPYKLLSVWKSMPIACMAVGGLFAYVHFIKLSWSKKIVQLLFTKKTQWLSVGALALLFFTGVSYDGFLHQEIYSIVFGVIILNMAINSNRLFNLEVPFLSYLGKISYGIYMYHPVAIGISIWIVKENASLPFGSIYLISFFLTILISILSYETIEKYFLRKIKRPI